MTSIENVFPTITRYFFSGSQKLLFDLFRENIDSFAVVNFSNDSQNHDFFFQQFTPIWINLIQHSNYKEAEDVWQFALSIASRWEVHNPQVHKGTPYYFLGVTQILANKLEDGFLSMQRARTVKPILIIEVHQ